MDSRLSNIDTTACVTLAKSLLLFQKLGFCCFFLIFKMSGWLKWPLTSFWIANSVFDHSFIHTLNYDNFGFYLSLSSSLMLTKIASGLFHFLNPNSLAALVLSGGRTSSNFSCPIQFTSPLCHSLGALFSAGWWLLIIFVEAFTSINGLRCCLP